MRSFSLRMAAAVFTIFLASQSSATTNCIQRLGFLALTPGPGSVVFWISEDLSGECYISQLHQIRVTDSKVVVVSTELEIFENWATFRKGVRQLNREPPVKVRRNRANDGTWVVGEGLALIRAPAKSQGFAQSFEEHVSRGGSGGSTWNKEHGLSGISLPAIDGLKAELIYYHPLGLSIDYAINDAYYFRRSGYILIFTHQLALAVGGDSMHGFLLLKVGEAVVK